MMHAPTTVDDIALPARSAIWSCDSRVSSRSSTGMPCSESTSSPMSGPPRLVMYGTMFGVRHGQMPGLPASPVSRSTFCERFHSIVL